MRQRFANNPHLSSARRLAVLFAGRMPIAAAGGKVAQEYIAEK